MLGCNYCGKIFSAGRMHSCRVVDLFMTDDGNIEIRFEGLSLGFLDLLSISEKPYPKDRIEEIVKSNSNNPDAVYLKKIHQHFNSKKDATQWRSPLPPH